MKLITGAGGFIGSHAVQRWTRDRLNDVVSIVHNGTVTEWLKHSLSRSILCNSDVRDFDNIKEIIGRYGVDEVYHLAAHSIVKTAHKIPRETYDINVMGTVSVLEACRQCDVRKIIIQSTDKVYGDRQKADVGDPLTSTDPYSASKIIADLIAQDYARLYGMKIYITRPCNIFGYDLNDRIIPNTIRVCLDGKSPVIYEHDDSTRQYMHVDTLIDAYEYITKHCSPGIYNICDVHEKTQEEVVRSVLDQFDGKIQPIYVERPKLREISKQSIVCNVNGWKQDPSTFELQLSKTIAMYRIYGW